MLFNVVNLIANISTVAIVIAAFFQIKQTSKLSRNERYYIVLEKLYYLLEQQAVIYPEMLPVLNDLQLYEDTKESRDKEKYLLNKDKLILKYPYDSIKEDLTQIELLSEIYLCEKLKSDMIALARFLRHLIKYVYNMNVYLFSSKWDNEAPNIIQFTNTIDVIQKKIIKEISVGSTKKVDLNKAYIELAKRWKDK